MPQQDTSGHQLKTIAIEYNGTTLTFYVNPQNLSYTRPQRASIYKTQSDNVIQQYGPDLTTIVLQGNTGLKRDSSGKNGQDRFKEISALLLAYQNDTENGGTPKTDLNFYNYTDDYYYTVTIPQAGFSYTRTVDSPLLFNYTLNFTVIKGAGEPSESDKINAELGAGSGTGGYAVGTIAGVNTGSYIDTGVATSPVTSASTSATKKASRSLKSIVGG